MKDQAFNSISVWRVKNRDALGFHRAIEVWLTKGDEWELIGQVITTLCTKTSEHLEAELVFALPGDVRFRENLRELSCYDRNTMFHKQFVPVGSKIWNSFYNPDEWYVDLLEYVGLLIER